MLTSLGNIDYLLNNLKSYVSTYIRMDMVRVRHTD
jgi:hypothetical protein